MTSKSRTLSGAALMLLIIPIFAGLLACMPVPIGDPERSRIDPDLTGIWALLTEYDRVFYVFEPYDKRTWLITGFAIEGGDLTDLSKYDLSTYEGFEKLAANEKVSVEHVYAGGLIFYKAWLTKLAGEQFFTWELRGKFDALTEDPEYWEVFKVSKEDSNTMVFRTVDSDSEPFEDIDETRRAYERVLKKHVNDPVIYGGPDDDDRVTFVRAEGSVLSFLQEIASDVVGN